MLSQRSIDAYREAALSLGLTLFSTADPDDFSLSEKTRHSLSAILIVHPIAALLTLICFLLAATAHLHSPSHSPRYLLALLILLLPTLLVTLLAFLVDILLFVPHLNWGGWIVLASTILIVASGVVTCAMRRTLVSRKARKKRIAENAEMNGDNFYARQNAFKADSPPPLSQQPTAPMVNGAPGSDKLPSFATFETKNRRPSDEDRIPLNQISPGSGNPPNSAGGYPVATSDDGSDRYGGSGRGGFEGVRGGRGGRPYNGPRDEFGNPLPPSAAFGQGPGQRRNSGDSRLRQQYSNETMNSQGSRGRGRGRGNYPPRGFGRGGPYNGGRGGPQTMNGGGRGIPMGPMASAGAGFAAGEVMGRGQRGPPPVYGNGYPVQGGGLGPGPYHQGGPPEDFAGPPSQYSGGASPGPPFVAGYGARQHSPGPASAPEYGARQRSPGPPSAPGYGARQRSSGPPSAPGYGYGSREQSPGGRIRMPRDSPPPPLPLEYSEASSGIGQAVEMDAHTGSPQPTPGYPPGHPLRDSDSDMQGMIGLQQRRMGSPSQHDESTMSPTSVYSGPSEYVQMSHVAIPSLILASSYAPPRAAWAGGVGRNNTPPLAADSHPLSPVELSAHRASPPLQQPPTFQPPTHNRNASADNYYEDVDPRFADPDPTRPSIPSLLMPGGRMDEPTNHVQPHMQIQPVDLDRLNDQQRPSNLEPTSSYESMAEGSRSPAASEASNFTSISQRGVNPDWRPPPGQGYPVGAGGVPNRRPVPQHQQRDVLLAGNPDFELPGAGRGGRGGSARGGGFGRGAPIGMGLGRSRMDQETAYMGNAI